jgi:hypothetical protein
MRANRRHGRLLHPMANGTWGSTTNDLWRDASVIR